MLSLVESGGSQTTSEILGCKLSRGEIIVIFSGPIQSKELMVDGVEIWFTIHNEPSSCRHEKMWIGYVNEATKEIELRYNGVSLKVVGCNLVIVSLLIFLTGRLPRLSFQTVILFLHPRRGRGEPTRK